MDTFVCGSYLNRGSSSSIPTNSWNGLPSYHLYYHRKVTSFPSLLNWQTEIRHLFNAYLIYWNMHGLMFILAGSDPSLPSIHDLLSCVQPVTEAIRLAHKHKESHRKPPINSCRDWLASLRLQLGMMQMCTLFPGRVQADCTSRLHLLLCLVLLWVTLLPHPRGHILPGQRGAGTNLTAASAHYLIKRHFWPCS